MQNIVRTYIAAIQLHAANKRKDIKSNNVLETFLEQFKEKDFNKKFKSIDRELFKLIKDEAHIYLSDGDKTKIINYFKYLRINYKYLKQNLQNESTNASTTTTTKTTSTPLPTTTIAASTSSSNNNSYNSSSCDESESDEEDETFNNNNFFSNTLQYVNNWFNVIDLTDNNDNSNDRYDV